MGLREDGESWEMHCETRETRCTVIFMCTLTKVCFFYAVRGGSDQAPEKQSCQTLTSVCSGDCDYTATITGAGELDGELLEL